MTDFQTIFGYFHVFQAVQWNTLEQFLSDYIKKNEKKIEKFHFLSIFAQF
jgi:hypothetical protein